MLTTTHGAPNDPPHSYIEHVRRVCRVCSPPTTEAVDKKLILAQLAKLPFSLM